LFVAAQIYCRVDKDTNMSFNRVYLLTPLSHPAALPDVVFLAARPGPRPLLQCPPPWHGHLAPLDSLWPCRRRSPSQSPVAVTVEVAVAVTSGRRKR
jgi:hypothetical protein